MTRLIQEIDYLKAKIENLEATCAELTDQSNQITEPIEDWEDDYEDQEYDWQEDNQDGESDNLYRQFQQLQAEGKFLPAENRKFQQQAEGNFVPAGGTVTPTFPAPPPEFEYNANQQDSRAKEADGIKFKEWPSPAQYKHWWSDSAELIASTSRNPPDAFKWIMEIGNVSSYERIPLVSTYATLDSTVLAGLNHVT